MKARHHVALLLAVIVSLASSSVWAAIKLPSVIGSNMVLQRDQAVPIWGWDDPGTEVTVTLGDAKATAEADADGKWKVELPAMKTGNPLTMTVEGTDKVTVENILVGEVWLCSGQSNMEWAVASSNNSKEEIAAANHPKIRHIKIPHVPAETPQENVASGGWQVCSPETVAGFTAVGYFFGRHLQQELDVPIGL
ncbi:MAG: 9-O-acetylesterase, partial [Planctomycetes bacterium]|nr:9-O-acetylesterase [Planctomycetota bacterium]